MVLERVRVSCPGTCGEWIQGIRGGVPFLVSAPVNRYAEVEVARLPRKWQIPTKKSKVGKALEIITEYTKIDFGGQVRFVQELPEGKGMASSTADIVAFIGAVFALVGIKPEPLLLAKLALRIEPSDSVMFPLLTEMDHLQGRVIRALGKSVPAKFLTLDMGGEVNTQDFNSRQGLRAHYLKNELEIEKAYKLFYEGINQGDLEKMAAGSTISARCNLDINPKPIFDSLLKWTKHQGGLGVLTAHSGTLIAGIFPNDVCLAGHLEEAKERFYPYKIEEFQTVEGGIKIEGREAGARRELALG